MKVKITKSIEIAEKSPGMPHVTVVEGEIRDDLSNHVANRLIELNCARLVDEPAVDESDEDEPEITGDATDANARRDPENTGDDASEGDDADVTPESLKAELEDIVLKAMEDPMGDDQKTKATLETLSKERYDFDVDKRMSVDNIILAIVEAAFKE